MPPPPDPGRSLRLRPVYLSGKTPASISLCSSIFFYFLSSDTRFMITMTANAIRVMTAAQNPATV